ncbi:MAG: redoxin domain-containing protein [Bryobacterales bacterium]|nr:redoxin domain-containing protein [Bryobacterales bacterium]
MTRMLTNALILLAGAVLFGCATTIAEQPAVRAQIQTVKERKLGPEFGLVNARQKKIALSDFRGKVVLLNFWATECGGCRVEIPYFAEFDQKYRSKGFEAVGLSMDISYEGLKGPEEAWARVNSFVKNRRLAFPILMADDAVGLSSRVTANNISTRPEGPRGRGLRRRGRQG